MPKIIVADGETGESIEREMTAEEIAHYEAMVGVSTEES